MCFFAWDPSLFLPLVTLLVLQPAQWVTSSRRFPDQPRMGYAASPGTTAPWRGSLVIHLTATCFLLRAPGAQHRAWLGRGR